MKTTDEYKGKGLILSAYSIMSSHIHLIATASEASNGLSGIIRDIKRHTSQALLKWILESRKEWLKVVFAYHAKNNKRNSKYQVWRQDNKPKELMHF